MVEVVYTDEFGEWFASLDEEDQERVASVVRKLEVMGLSLPMPHAKALHVEKHALRELRPSRGQSPLRIVYAFDPSRDAVLLIGGDKGGDSDERFFGSLIPKAVRIWEQYLAEHARGEHED